ncbi:MAG: NAD(P)-binding domain-containing protein, partial [Bacteroidota bacterium]
MRVGFLGTGTIAAAMVRGIAGERHEIVVSERGRKFSAELSTEFPNVTIADNQTVVDESDVVIVGLMADVAREVLPTLRFRPNQHVFSVMVGIGYAELQAILSDVAEVGIFIPFPFIATGGSPLLVY